MCGQSRLKVIVRLNLRENSLRGRYLFLDKAVRLLLRVGRLFICALESIKGRNLRVRKFKVILYFLRGRLEPVNVLFVDVRMVDQVLGQGLCLVLQFF